MIAGPVDEVPEYLVEFILIVKIVSVIMIVHEHDEFFTAETRHVRIPLFIRQIPPLKNHVVVITGLEFFHAFQNVKETKDFIPAGPLARGFYDFEKFAEARLPEHPQVVLKFRFLHCAPILY